MKAFSLFLSNGELSKFAKAVGSSGRLLAKNMLASECMTGYAKLLENVIKFSSHTLLPSPIPQLQQGSWEWDLFEKEVGQATSNLANINESDTSFKISTVVRFLEEKFANNDSTVLEIKNQSGVRDIPSEQDWEVLMDIENHEESERLEIEEVQYLGSTIST